MNLAELRRLHEAATPGPWEAGGTIKCECGESSQNCWHTYTEQAEIFPPLGYSGPIATVGQCEYDDAALIAAARNALPELLDRLEELEAENARLREALESIVFLGAAHQGTKEVLRQIAREALGGR